ncbi:chymotrypsin-2-like [Tetranychus urticae]|uniref:Peptidase S1 domain-containing protein n=1 Tax=Tetranychus urticae TaxID=32264 RepID=T1K8T6_TETUR|nr:chymotrypsin-2-like [Tetranychus urticae]
MMIFHTILVMVLYSNLVSSTDIEDSTEQYERVAKGSPVPEGAYPFFVSIQKPDPNSTTGYTHRCGGSLISAQFVVTAAHCLVDTEHVREYRVLPNYRNTPFIHPTDRTFKIPYHVIHPGYNLTGPKNIKHDIAVLLLDQPDPRPNAIIRLPFVEIPLQEPVTLIGFGKIETQAYPGALRSAVLFRKSDQECVAENKGIHYFPVFNLCTSNVNGSGSCFGDSGGPLFLTVDNIHYIQGVVASSYPPCGSYHITNFASVFGHMDFIHQAISYLNFFNQISNQHNKGQFQMKEVKEMQNKE